MIFNLTLKGFVVKANAFSVGLLLDSNPGLSLRSNHWAEISQRLRRNLLKFQTVRTTSISSAQVWRRSWKLHLLAKLLVTGIIVNCNSLRSAECFL